jgi:tRNA threonylcarbamoyl adenosine modification protein (Sua5/YciO/YrdC/YwlC family)
MSSFITLSADNFDETVDAATALINAGGIAVVAAEHGYLYVANAFDHEAVRQIHILRGDAKGTASQVMIGSADVLPGLAIDFDDELKALANEFWPGLLSLHVMGNAALTWDLGDSGELSEFAVRVPAKDFLRALAAKTGPLAAASAAIAGTGPSHEIQYVPAHESSIAIYIDEGVLPPGPASSVVHRRILGKPGGLELIRLGAISGERLQAVVPTLTVIAPVDPSVN